MKVRLLGLGILVLLFAGNGFGQETEAPEDRKPVAFVRIWTLLPNLPATDLFDVRCSGIPGDVLFSSLSPLDSRLYTKVPVGSHRLSLVRAGAESGSEPLAPEIDLDAGDLMAYTLLVVWDQPSRGPKWVVLKDFPIEPGEEGLHVFNFLGQEDFLVSVDGSQPAPLPESADPIHLPVSKVAGKEFAFSRMSKRGTPIETRIDAANLTAASRVNVIFTRNSYGQPVAEILKCADPREIGFGE